MLTFILLDYRSAKETVTYIHHLCEKISKVQESVSFVVVDNSVDPLNFDFLSKAFKTIEKKKWNDSTLEIKEVYGKPLYLWANVENVGYARGNNSGAKIALDFIKSDYLLFSNNDLIVLDPSLDLDRLIQEQKKEGVAIVGPSIIGKNGEKQNPYKEKSFFLRWGLEYLLYPCGSILPQSYRSGDVLEPFTSNPVFRVMGSFFLISSSSFWLVDGMDPHTFLFAEELILAKRLQQVNLLVHYVDSVHLLHNHSTSINKYYNQTERLKQRFKSELYYYQKYVGVGKFIVFVVKKIFSSYLIRKEGTMIIKKTLKKMGCISE